MNGIFSGCTDEELVEYSRGGASDAADVLMERYKEMVRLEASSLHLQGAEHEDLIQEGMLGLFKALRDYDADRGASFKTFAVLCVRRQLCTAVEASSRRKHQPLNTAISYDTTAAVPAGLGEGSRSGSGNAEDGAESMVNLLPSDEPNPEIRYISEESRINMEQAIQEALSPYEQEVLGLSLDGLGYLEIAQRLGREPKSVDNALQRIRRKVKRLLAD